MTWALAGTGAVAGAASTNITPVSVAYPAGIVSGDILFLAVAAVSAGRTATIADAGFAFVEHPSGLDTTLILYGKVATGSEAGATTVSLSASDFTYAQIARFTGGTLTVDGTNSKAGTGQTVCFWAAQPVTAANCLVLGLTSGFFASGVSGNINTPSPWTGQIGAAFSSPQAFLFGWDYVIQTTATNIPAGSWAPAVTGTGNYSSITVSLQTSSGPTLQTIAVTPAAISLAAGQTQQYTATGHYSDGSTQNLTSTATWTSSNGSFATISSSGLATAVATGTTTITATSGSISGNTTLTVGIWISIGALNGTLAGTPPDVETDLIQIQVQDALGVKASSFFTLQVQQASSTWFGANLPTAPTTFTTTSAPPSAANTNRGSYYTPGVGGDTSLTLQNAINAAASAAGSKGDVIVLQAGTTYTSSSFFNLPTRTGSGWIYLISSQAPEIGGSGLPPAGTRVSLANIANMASLRTSSTTQNGYVVQRSSAAGFYRLVGMDIQLTDANQGSGTNQTVINFNNGDTSTSTLANNMTLDRCYVAGGPSTGVTRALQIDGTYIEVTECYFDRVWSQGNGDTQAIAGWNGIGPYKITNNYLSAMGEITLWGGADSSLPSPNMASDILIQNNHYYKPILTATASLSSGSTTLTISAISYGALYPTMLLQDPSGNVPAGIVSGTYIVKQLTGTTGSTGTYQMSVAATANESGETINAISSGKNMFEFKCAQRVSVNSNYFENSGANGQARSATTITVRNQSGGNPWNTVSDVSYTNNIFTNANFGGLDMLLQDSTSGGAGGTQPCFRILFRNNLYMFGVSNPLIYMGSNNPPSESGGGTGGDIIFDHNTFIATSGMSQMVFLDGSYNAMQLKRIVFSNNIFDNSVYGFTGGTGTYNSFSNATTQCTPLVSVNTVYVGSTDASIPATNFKPANDTAVGFTSYGSLTLAAGYALTGGSTYHAKGVSGANLPYTSGGTADGSDIGCNISLLPTS